MEVGNAVTQANHRERVSHQAVTIKSAQHFAAGMRGHNKHGSRLDLQVGFSPNLALELDTTMEIIEALTFPNDDVPGHGFVGAPPITGKYGFPSDFLVWSQNTSICSRGRFLNSRPYAGNAIEQRDFLGDAGTGF